MLILLDVDGVMVIIPSWRKVDLLDDGFPDFDRKAVDNINRIISGTNASIVLTTSHKSKFSISEWKGIFHKRGVNVTTLSRLDDNVNDLSRKDEILNWLNNRTSNEDYVIIDDDKSLNGLPDYVKDKFVMTDSLIGLDDKSTLKALDILKSQADCGKPMTGLALELLIEVMRKEAPSVPTLPNRL